MSSHSSIVGGSTAARMLNCPGHVALSLALPAVVDQPSPYADEGTALHTAIGLIIEGDIEPEALVDTEIKLDEAYGVVITRELYRERLAPAVAFYDELDRSLSSDAEIVIEKTFPFPNVAGAFGTVDLLAYSAQLNHTHVVDWKFGVGESVFAAYPDPDDPEMERINEQALFYACAARFAEPALFGNGTSKITLTIVQPQSKDHGVHITSTDVTHEELDSFEAELAAAVERSREPGAPMKMGSWCRFAPCRPICPLYRKPILDLAAIRLPPAPLPLADYQALLLEVLEAADTLEELIREARTQAKSLLAAEQPLPGWKLVPARANRAWAVLEKGIVSFARKHGLKKDQLYKTEFVSPAQLEKLLPAKVKLEEGMTKKESRSFSLAREGDTREERPVIGAIGKLLASVKAGAYSPDRALPAEGESSEPTSNGKGTP